MPTLDETKRDEATQAILEREEWREDADATGERIVIEGLRVKAPPRPPVVIYGVSKWKEEMLAAFSGENPFRLRISKELRRIFMLGEDEDFEDGGESEFRQSLGAAIVRDGAMVVTLIREMILGGTSSNVVAAEALACLAELQDPKTHGARLEALEAALGSSSIVIRDAAILGLVNLADPSAVPSVERAWDVEMHPALRAELEYALTRLLRQN